MSGVSQTEVDVSWLKELNLASVGNNRYIGHIERVPFRLEIVSNSQTIGLLFHTRYSKAKQAIPESPPAPGSLLGTLLIEKKAEFTADESQIWFNLFAAHELIASNTLFSVLREFAKSLEPYIDFDNQTCFGCKQAKATKPVYHSEKLHLICESCEQRLNEVAKKLNSFDAGTIVFSLLWAIVVALIGGGIWAAGWFTFIKSFGGLKLPEIVFVLAFTALGGVLAFPIAWIFKKIPRRGRIVPNWITILTCVATAIVGEAFICDAYFLLVEGRFPDSDEFFFTWRLLLTEFGAFYVICKLITLGALCAFTLDWLKPKVPLEQLVSPTTH